MRAVLHAAVARAIARMRVLAERPLRRRGDEFGDHDLDAVLSGEIHHAVVVAPVVLAGRDLDGAPHEPVAEGVHADARGGLMVAGPVLLRRIGFAEVDRAVREDGLRRSGKNRDRARHRGQKIRISRRMV